MGGKGASDHVIGSQSAPAMRVCPKFLTGRRPCLPRFCFAYVTALRYIVEARKSL